MVFKSAKLKVSDGITDLAVSSNGQGGLNHDDVFSVTLDEANKRFSYEGRFDRIYALGCGGSCGWSRHYRMFLDLPDETEENIYTALSIIFLKAIFLEDLFADIQR